MNPRADEAGRQPLSAQAQAIQRLYESVSGVLLRFLTGRFRLSDKDAEDLLCRICFEAMSQTVRNREAWTISASCNGAKTLRRRQDEGMAAPPPDMTLEEIEALREVVLVNQGLATLTEHGREALRLRFREQRSYAEIAEALDISTRYAKQLVALSLARLRASQRAGRADDRADDEQDR